jgi:AraC-like DNA-binding protein
MLSLCIRARPGRRSSSRPVSSLPRLGSSGMDMKRGGSESNSDSLAVYAELRPIPRHQSLIDHLFVFRDRGRLADAGGHLFGSPFSEIVAIGRYPDQDGKCQRGKPGWKALHLPPRFGRKPRPRGFHGWMLGVRCRPLDLPVGDPVFASLSERIEATFHASESDNALDPLIAVLDEWIEDTAARLAAASSPHLRVLTSEAVLSESNRDRAASVVAIAARAGVDPRTLQRRFRKGTGLAPKQYATVRRFSTALHQLALGSESVAAIAAELGYADQSHLTSDLGRQAGTPPGRFRARARPLISRDAVRFFKDGDVRSRVRLLVCDSYLPDDLVSDDETQSGGHRIRGPRPR